MHVPNVSVCALLGFPSEAETLNLIFFLSVWSRGSCVLFYHVMSD